MQTRTLMSLGLAAALVVFLLHLIRMVFDYAKIATVGAETDDVFFITSRTDQSLEERGALTNSEIRRLTGLSRPAVVRLMQELREEGLAKLEGRGRGARWVRRPSSTETGRRRRRK